VDLTSGCAGVVLSLGVCYGALGMPMGSPGNPGAGFLPFWIGVTLATLSLLLLIAALLEKAPPPERRKEEGEGRYAARMLGGLLLYTLFLDILGFLATTLLLLAALVRLLGQRGWLVALGFSALATAGSYALFALWLGVPLPAGSLFR
jgi:hypothetical protein